MRKELKKREIKKLKVVYSEELPIQLKGEEAVKELMEEKPEGRRAIPGSNAFVPSAAGLVIASEVIKDLVK